MSVLAEILNDARKRQIAVGHFNVSELTFVKAIAEAARELKLPVIVAPPKVNVSFWARARLLPSSQACASDLVKRSS
jgi:fructose/tagatose bisphosphate aldolase